MPLQHVDKEESRTCDGQACAASLNAAGDGMSMGVCTCLLGRRRRAALLHE